MDGTRVNRPIRALGAVLALVVALLMCGPIAGVAQADVAAPAGDAISIGDPAAPGQIDLYVDPLCPFSGKMIQSKGGEIGQRIEAGKLHVNLRFVDFLDKYSASGSYDNRAIYATYAVAGMSQSSDITWRFVQRIFSAEQQPKEHGPTDLSNDQLAGLAHHVGAPQTAQDLIRFGLPIGYDARAVASNNYTALHRFPKPSVPLVVIDGQPVDGASNWLDQLPR
ncbi:DsbA family protein [Mycobacterium sp. 21AC1]|uniref:thioredoxin domain-containing protein n=1 Tax=[Mycobacterium] appelbergii TaxID=2939269 RepID=UPI002938DA01|nr:thioredoxin domain-containing protein [Mycobacterium sp. 21AC1]MDV3125299.1 DsbA family protein [Mycobacterium sp. 21AC1]